MPEDEIIVQARKFWQMYLSLTKELLKFIDKQDIEMFNDLVRQRESLIEKLKALPSAEYLKLDEFKKIGEEIKPLDKEIMYKARAWLIKSRRQNNMVRSYDIGSSLVGRSSVAFNRKY